MDIPVLLSCSTLLFCGEVSLIWESRKSKDLNEVWLRWKQCKDSEPKVILIGANSGSHTFQAGRFPSGSVIFEAVIHDGFDSVVSEPVSIDIPASLPSVAIVHPYHHQTLQNGYPMQLHGLVSDEFGNPMESKECHWLLDGKPVAEGLEIYVPTPPAGLHKVTLVVKAKTGSHSAESEIMVIE